MPATKNAQFRYQILDRCFGDPNHKYDFDELLDVVNDYLVEMCGTTVSVRQLRDDISAIRKMLPFDTYLDAIPLNDKRCYYRYSVSGFSIYNNELSVEDVQKLRSTIDMLSRYRGVPNNAWLEEVISNLEYRFGIKSNKDNVVSFDQNAQLKGLEYLSNVIDAAVNRTPLVVSYKTYSGNEITSTFHPYHVKQYNNRWFLFGYDEEYGRIANKALDRIQSISLAKVPFRPNTELDFNHYFDDVVGVTVPNDDTSKEVILLRFSDARFPYVTSKPIHQSQKTVSENEHIISIEVIPTRELEQQILSFGPDVEVLKPDDFRQAIAKKISETAKKYFTVQKDCTDNTFLCSDN